MQASRQCAPDPALGWRWATLIFAAALALRFAYLPTAAADPTFRRPYLDALWNVQHASAIAHGHLAGSEPFYRAPLYTYFLAGLLFLTGGNLLWVHIAQIVLGSLTAALVGTLGARLIDRWVGMLAGLLYAGTATVLLFDFEFLNAVVFLPLVVTMLLALERATREPSPRRFLETGLALGLAAIARPDILAFVPVALAIAGGAAWRAGWRPSRLLAGGGLLCTGLALAIVPVTIHNAIAGRDSILISSQGGAILYVSNNPRADGYTSVMPGPTDTASYAADGAYTDNIESSSRYLARLALGHEPKPSEVSRYWRDRALAWIMAEPRAWASLVVRKAFYLMGGFEIGDQRNLTFFLDTWPPFAAFPRWWWLFPLALAALTLPGDRRGRLLLGAFAATYGVTLVAFVPEERLRLALYPALCIMAARFLLWAIGMFRSRQLRPLAVRLAFVGALAVAMRWDPTGYTVRERVESRIARASDSERRSDSAAAERLFLDALTIDPSWPNARAGYALFLERHGRESEARAVGGPLWQRNATP